MLVDGVPPGLLPSSVVEDQLYLRTFGKRNFEMVVLGFCHYRTARRVDSRFLYEFMVDSSDTLHILEFDNCGDKLLLLRKDELDDLPPLLREKHSHWFSERYHVVIMRGQAYRDRRVEYAITPGGTYVLSHQIHTDTLLDMTRKFQACNRLVLGETSVSETLGNFEYQEYIHLTVDPEGTLICFSFPRYKLSFQLKDGILVSDQFKNFSMQDMRVLDDTIPGLRSYFVLAHSDGRQKVLINEGKIGRLARIEIPSDWCADVSYHIYDVHRRFKFLLAVDTVGRFYLAGLYASSGCAIADKRMGRLGTVVATELVRQSWKNEPFSDAELSKLVEVSSHSNLSCTLRLMCTWLWMSSNSVSFLHDCIDKTLQPELVLDMQALDEYRQSEFAPRLMPCEEFALLGIRQPKRETLVLPRHKNSATVALVHNKEHVLRKKYMRERPSNEGSPFPLVRPESCSGLEFELYEELARSYKTSCKQPMKFVRSVDVRDIESEMHQIESHRVLLESSLLRELSKGDESSKHHWKDYSSNKCRNTLHSL